MYIKYNMNPCDKRTIDCSVRALSALMDKDWDTVYLQLVMTGFGMCDMPSSKAVINEYLRAAGYQRYLTPDKVGGYTVRDFSEEHRTGKYLLATDSHVVPVISGNYIDTWDSGLECPLFYWKKVIE